jgi:hypothetical protein
VFGVTVIAVVTFVAVPVPRYVDLSAHPPVLTLSLARVWFDPSVQLSAFVVVPLSKPGFRTRFELGGEVFVGVGVFIGVGVFVGVDVFVGVQEMVEVRVGVPVAPELSSKYR